MIDEPRLKIIRENTIGKGLDAFRASFNSVCKGTDITCSPGALELLSREGMSVSAVIALELV